MTVLAVPIVSIVLAVAMILVLAKTERERPQVRKETVKLDHKEGLTDLLLLIEREMSSVELETGFLGDVRKRLRRKKRGR